MAFFLLLLLTAIFFVRPAEWAPGWVGQPLFEVTLWPCLAISLGACSGQLSSRSLSHYPISACVLGLLAITFVSESLSGTASFDATIAFSKACIFYLLVVAIVDSKRKLAIFLGGLACILFVMGLLILLNYHGVLSVDVGLPLAAQEDTSSQFDVRVEALGGATFDPNDTAALLVLGILISVHYVTTSHRWVPRTLWLAMTCVTVYVFQLTDSRGGFLALLVGVLLYVWMRWGKKGLAWGLCLLPLVVAQIATERMAGISTAITEDTGRERLWSWCQALVMFKHHPILGTGPGGFSQQGGRASHNSFLQAYAELGFVGGTLFVGAFFCGIAAMYRLARSDSVDPEVSGGVDPVVCLMLALLGAYGVAIYSLSHLFATNTYLILGLATVCARVYGATNSVSAEKLAGRFCAVGVAFLLISHVTARFLLRW